MRLLILHDSPDFGGHEIAFLDLLPGLLERPMLQHVSMMHASSNQRLGAALAPMVGPRFKVRTWEHQKGRAEPYVAPFRAAYAKAVRDLIAAERPDRILLIQGRIENLAVPMLNALGIPIISYVPMAHGMAEMAGGVKPLGDRVRRRYYARPDRFITVSHAVEAQLRTAGATGDIRVVRNVARPASERRPVDVTRADLGVPQGALMALFIGRFEDRQKRIGVLLKAIAGRRAALKDVVFVFVGAGPSMPMIEAAAREAAGAPAFVVRGWTDRPDELMAAADVVLMPSRFEGVPLSMLEAMSLGVPVLGSNIDVFREYLPPDNVIDFEATSLDTVLSGAVARRLDFAAWSNEKLASHALSTSREAFVSAVLDPVSGRSL